MKEPQLAFPVIGTITGKPNALGQQQMMGIYQSGMTLRDYFAAQVAPTFIQMRDQEGVKMYDLKEAALAAYNFAEWLMTVRGVDSDGNGK